MELEALVAYDIDFPEEDSGPVDPRHIEQKAEGVCAALQKLLDAAFEGERLKEGALAVIAGRPNVGKSSLFNALLGAERAIVTEIPGTTRDAIEAPAVCGGFPFRLVDTAGLRETRDLVEGLGVEVSWRYLRSADLVLFCAESGRPLRDEETTFLEEVDAPVVMVRTKSDLEAGPDTPDEIAVSASSGDGLRELREAMARRAFEGLSQGEGNARVLTRARHRVAVARASDEMASFVKAREEGIEMVAAATHLRAAASALDDVIGAIVPDDVLDVVFRSFCIGK